MLRKPFASFSGDQSTEVPLQYFIYTILLILTAKLQDRFFFSIFQIRKLRLKVFGKLSWVTQPVNGRIEILIQRVRLQRPKSSSWGIPERLLHAVREPQIDFCLALWDVEYVLIFSH